MQAKAKGDEISLVVSNDQHQVRFLSVVEIFRPDALADIAVGLVNQDAPSVLSLSSERVAIGNAVYCLGYPGHLFRISHIDKRYSVPLRFMRGHIQSDIWVNHEVLQAHQAVDYYELNFAIPQGVSGAPVIFEETNIVIGICVGTQKGQKLDHIEERELGKETKIYEIEQIGIAQMSSIIANVKIPWLV